MRGKIGRRQILSTEVCGSGSRRRWRYRLLEGFSAQLGQLAFERFHASGQGGQIRGDLRFVWLPSLLLMLVRGHGNYFTAILRRSGTAVRQLVVFAQRKMSLCRSGFLLSTTMQ